MIAKPDSRILPLDGLRGIASLMVVAYHLGPLAAQPGAEESHFGFLRQLPAFWFGGVDLFFVLSGFPSGILVDARNSPNYFRTFYFRRVFRIFPLYYIVLALYGIAVLSNPNPHWRLFAYPLPYWTYVVYVQNIAMTAASSFGAIWMAGSWSLAVEEQFYLTLPIVIRRLSDRGLFWFVCAGLCFAPVLRALIQRFRFMSEVGSYVLLPTAVDDLAIGVLVMLLLRHRTAWLMPRRRRIAWLTAGAVLFWSIYPYIPNPQAIRLAFLSRTITGLNFGLILVCILLFPESRMSRFLSTTPMRNLGNMAYSTYLFHPIILCLAFRVIEGRDPFLNTPRDLLPVLVTLTLTLPLSWWSWSGLESRLVRVGRRFCY